jgi:hypothetical protein
LAGALAPGGEVSDQGPREESRQPADSARSEGVTDISALATREELVLELGREAVRIRREERRGLGAYWRGSVVLLALLVLIAIVSIAVIVHGLISDSELIVPALGALCGSGGGGIFLWRSYSQRFRSR